MCVPLTSSTKAVQSQFHAVLYISTALCCLQGNTMIDGLYAGETSLTVDFKIVVQRVLSLGFNSVRLLTSFQVNHSTLR